jgi:hypothetical protein
MSIARGKGLHWLEKQITFAGFSQMKLFVAASI